METMASHEMDQIQNLASVKRVSDTSLLIINATMTDCKEGCCLICGSIFSTSMEKH